MARASQDEVVERVQDKDWTEWVRAVGDTVIVQTETASGWFIDCDALLDEGWTIAALDMQPGYTRIHATPMPEEQTAVPTFEGQSFTTEDLEEQLFGDTSSDGTDFDAEVVDHTEADEWDEYDYYRRLAEGTRPHQAAKALAESDREWTSATDIKHLFDETGDPYANAYLHLHNLVRANVAEKDKDDDGSVAFRLREPFRREFAQFDPLNNDSATAPADD